MRKFHISAALGLSAAAFLPGFPVLNGAPNFGWSDAPSRTFKRRKQSKYMPHIGAKERARHAGKPDGPMHKVR